ncbi:MAG: Ig-like domain-containing protein, partial [Eubacteriales bacterium]|nr:Ig-like domain-containing protein [Eubacteriales bacterium]
GKPKIVLIYDVVNGSVANIGSGKVLVSADGDFHGTVTFSYTIMDRAGATASADVILTVNPSNDPPRVKDDAITIFEDETAQISVLANDIDPEGDTLSIVSVTSPAHGTAQINGTKTKIDYVPETDYFGTDSFNYTVSDGNGGTATATVRITLKPVNDAPTIDKHSSNAGDWTMLEDTPEAFHFVVADAESAASNLIVKITSLDETLIKTAQIVLSTNAEGYKTIAVNPVPNAHGTAYVKFWVSDGLLSTQAVYEIEIISVNDAPVVIVPLQSTLEDTLLRAKAYATDADNDDVTFEKHTDPAHGSVTVYPDGSFDYMPAKDYNGQDTFIIRADDGNMLNNLGFATVFITVKPDGDPPEAKDDTITINEDTPSVIPVLVNDSDVDAIYGDVISILRVTSPAHGTAAITEGGILYTPDEHYNGSDSFTYTITDHDGKTDSATVTVTILPVNDAPSGGDDTATVLEDHSVTIDAAANDDMDLLTNPELENVTIIAVEKPAHGIAVIDAGYKTITYTPDANWFSPEGEPEVFYYTAKDASGLTERFAIRVTVVSVNDLPVITPGDLPDVVTDEDTATTPITFTVSDVETAAGSLTVTATHGNSVLLPAITVTPDAEGVCSFTILPNANRVGSAAITVTVTDADGGQVSDTFTLTVTPINDAPRPGDDAFTVTENQTLTYDVLANDDVDILAGNGGDTLTLLSITTPQFGTATIDNNQLRYVPDADRNATESYQDVFTYKMKDASGSECTPTVTVTVTPVNDAPIISAIADMTGVLEDAPDGTGEISFHVTDEEDDDDTLTISVESGNLSLFPLSNITITNPGGEALGSLRTVKAVPAENQFGTGKITLTVRDAQGLSASEEFWVTVDSVNDIPDNGDKSFTVVEDVETQLDVLEDIDPDYATTPEKITITAIATQPNHGTVRIAADQKSIYYTTDQDSNEPD